MVILLKLHFFSISIAILVFGTPVSYKLAYRKSIVQLYCVLRNIIYILDMELCIYNYIIFYIGIYTLYPCIEKASHVLYSWRQVVESKIGFDGNRLYSCNI